MTLSETDRARIVEPVAAAIAPELFQRFPQIELYRANYEKAYKQANDAIDAALSSGLAEAIREQALREAVKVARGEILLSFPTIALDQWDHGYEFACKEIAAAIESLIGKPAEKPAPERGLELTPDDLALCQEAVQLAIARFAGGISQWEKKRADDYRAINKRLDAIIDAMGDEP